MNYRFNVHFNLREFWFGLTVRNAVANFSDLTIVTLGLFFVYFTITRSVTLLRDYGEIVEKANNVDTKKTNLYCVTKDGFINKKLNT